MHKPSLLLFAFYLGLNVITGSAETAAPEARPALPPGTPLLNNDLHSFRAYGLSPETASVEVAPVEEREFASALRLTTLKTPPRYWDYGTTAEITKALHAGDVLWITLWARRVTTRRESGEAEVEVVLMQKVDGKETRPLERRLSVGPRWTQFSLPLTLKKEAALGDLRIGFRFGYGLQSLEIGNLQLLDYGHAVKEEDLPRTVIRYEGWEMDAPWRKAAAERIEQLRKGNFSVRVTGANGVPVSGASIAVRMKRHAFAWGTAIDETHILDTQDPANERYREVLETYFNKVVFDNSLKWGRWAEGAVKERVLAALFWLEERNIAVRGHVLLWPSWQHLPKSVAALKENPEALKRAIAEHIADQTSVFKGRLAEWDVINESFKHHDLLDLLGRGAMVDWFRQTKTGIPTAKLFYNDYTMFQPGEGEQYFYDTIKYLQEQGAPIEGIGEQGHFASSPPGIPDVLATLDHFGEFGLPIQLSEFDIDTDDAGLQADFMRDFTTAVFSHPSVMGVVQWGFWEGAHWLPRAALWDRQWKLRPHGKVWVDLVSKIWWTNADGSSNAKGSFAGRGFYGDYEVTVTQGEKTRTAKFALTPNSSAWEVVLP